MKRAALILGALGLTLAAACLSRDVEERFREGTELLFENRYEDAESYFLALARELDRENGPERDRLRARALYQAGRIERLYLNQPRRAVANLREALKLDPQAPYAFNARRAIGRIFQDRLFDYRSAALEFERMLQLFPNRPGIERYRYRIAQCYFQLQDFEQARAESQLLLQKVPQGPLALQTRLLLGNAYYSEGRYADAAKVHEEIVTLDPPVDILSRSLFELGLCYQETAQFDRAEEVFQRALKIHPNPTLVQAQLSILRERREESEKNPASVPVPSVQRAQPPTPPPSPQARPAAAPAPVPKSAPAEPPKPAPPPATTPAPPDTAPAPTPAPKEEPAAPAAGTP